MFISLRYLMLRWLLQLVALRVRSDEWKELEIVVLRHELAILRRQTRRPPITVSDRVFLTAVSRFLPRARWQFIIVTPATLLSLVGVNVSYFPSPSRFGLSTMICQNGKATSLRHLLCFVNCCRFLVLPKIGKFARHGRKPGDLCLTDGRFSAVTNGQ